MAYPDGFKYTKDHEWIEPTGDRGKVGITDYAQQQLGDVVYVELPEVGAKLKAGQSVMFKVLRRSDRDQILTVFLPGVIPPAQQ